MKQFTSILFGLVLVLGLGIEKVSAQNSQRSNFEVCKDEAKSKGIDDPAWIKNCLCIAEPGRYDCPGYKDPDKASAKSDCVTASKEYYESMKKNPCTDTSVASECQKKINSCVANSSMASTPGGLDFGSDELNGLSSQVMELFKAKNAKDQQTTPGFQPDRSCYKKIKSTDKEVKKDRAAKVKEIKKEIEEETKKINEADAKLKRK